MARQAHQPTDQQRRQVEAMAGYGVPIKQIAAIMDMSDNTLMKHYRKELDAGDAKATAKVAETLYRKAVEDRDTASIIFWMKARAGWSEKQRLEHTGPNGAPLGINVRFVD